MSRLFYLLAGGLLAPFSFLACAQSSYTTSTEDVNGNRVQLGPSSSTSRNDNTTTTTQTMRSINGRTVPVEQVEERVLRDDANGKTVERTVRRYDETGNPAGVRRTVIEQENHAGGGSTTHSTTYAADINGRMAVTERSTTETQVSGSTVTADTLVERPTINGSLETVEKQNVV